MCSIIAASVVDLPEPVVPGHEDHAPLLLGEPAHDVGEAELGERADRVGHDPKDHRDRTALPVAR